MKKITLHRSWMPLCLSLFLWALAPAPAAPLPDNLKSGLVLHFDFASEPSGGTIVDASGNGNNGQATGVTWVPKGHNGAGCAQFGLNNCYITVPNNDSLNPPQFTLAAWIKSDYTDSLWRRLFDKGYNKSYALSICGDWPAGDAWRRGQVALELGAGGGTDTGVRVTDGQWHHVAATFDGSEARLFVDGNPAGHVQRSQGRRTDPSFNLTLGANRSNPNASLGEVNASFNGQMGDVMIYRRALPADEIQKLFLAQGGTPTPPSPRAQVVPAGADLKYGLYIHYGLPTFAHPGESGEIPAARFAPAGVNTASWAHLAKESGMTFAILTAKHESGFCLWPGQDYDYDVSSSLYKGDIIGDFIAACNSEGILPGIHYSLPDAHNEGTPRGDGPIPKLYFNLIKKQITELHTKYPGLRLQLFDNSKRFSPEQWDEITAIIQRLNPQCRIIDQLEGGVTHYAFASVNQGWMWRAGQNLAPASQLLNAYNRAQSAHQAFILNVGPNPQGEVPENQAAVLKSLKEMIANPDAAPATPAPAAAGGSDATERLKKLQSLYDQGLITKDEYEKKKKEIMDAL